MSGSGRALPKHQNRYAWKPNAGHKKNENELGGKFRPYSEITGVCQRCKDQIEWKRRYGKYKPLIEPKKCQQCGKRAVRQAHHNLCSACAKERNVCAKCSCHVERIVGRDVEDVEAERKALDEAIRNARERDRRTLLRAINKTKSGGPVKPVIGGLGNQAIQRSTTDEHDDGDDTEISEDEDNDDGLVKPLSVAVDKLEIQSFTTGEHDDENTEISEDEDEDEDDEDDDPCD